MAPGSPSEKKFRPYLTLAMLVIFSVLVVWRMQTTPEYRERLQGFVFSGTTMGTTWQAKVVAKSLTIEERQAIENAIREAVDSVDQRMSTYKPESELSRFNGSEDPGPFALSPETIHVLEIAQQVHALSGGAFDPTVGPLVDAWGFGPDEVVGGPSAAEIVRLLEEVGFDNVVVDSKGKSASKSLPSVRVDLSGIAKGYAVDQVAASLLELGYTDFMIEIGGETVVHGESEHRRPFRIGVERPAVGETRTLLDVLSLTDLAVATSGDYRNYREVDGKRVSHTIDPRTGRPIDHRLASVSVVHESCTYADAMATALNVLGPEAGMALARSNSLAAQFVVRTAHGEFESHATESFKGLLVGQDKE
jgi:FAD:protein FMN transferase